MVIGWMDAVNEQSRKRISEDFGSGRTQNMVKNRERNTWEVHTILRQIIFYQTCYLVLKNRNNFLQITRIGFKLQQNIAKFLEYSKHTKVYFLQSRQKTEQLFLLPMRLSRNWRKFQLSPKATGQELNPLSTGLCTFNKFQKPEFVLFPLFYSPHVFQYRELNESESKYECEWLFSQVNRFENK